MELLLEAIRAEYNALDARLGIDTSALTLSFSTRMVRRYGVCCFRGDVPTGIRLAAFLQAEPEQLRQTALHEYAHAAAALLSGKRHGHDALWKQLCLVVGCSPQRLAAPCAAAEKCAAEYENSRLGATEYLVRCRACGAVSRYRRRGKVVQLLLEHPKSRALICKRCSGRSFELTMEEKSNDKA